jgi:uncharacterized protein (TIRG00374 family)
MKRLLYVLLLTLAVVFVLSQLAEFEQIAATLRRGVWYWLALAAAVQAVYLVNLAAGYRAAFQTVGVHRPLSAILPLVVAANFVNVVTASGGIAGMALFAGDARRRNQSAARVTVGGVLYVLADYAAFLCVLALGFAVLVRRHDLSAADVIAAGILVLAAGALGALLLVGLRSAPALERLLAGAARLANRALRPALRRDHLPEAAARAFARDAALALGSMRTQPRRNWLLPFGLALSAKALLIVILFLVFLAFGQAFSPGTLIAAFSLAYLFYIVSPTPSGLGVVEGALPLALRSLRVPLGSALVITLAYRGLTFWLPFLYGFLALRWLGRAPAGGPAGAPAAGDERDLA